MPQTTAYSLTFHTTSPDLGLALLRPDGSVCHQVSPLGRDLSSQLHMHLADFIGDLAWTSLGWLAVCIGPGGFTSTRIGAVTARTLAQQLEIPLFGVSSLAAMAHASGQEGPVAVTLPAKRGAVYGAIYTDRGRQAKLPPNILPADAWQAQLEDWAGPLQQVEISTGQGLGASVVNVLQLAQYQYQIGERPHWSDVVPFYGQSPVTS
ncbi:MAG: tRNA (adenosine(37)-N6)-threonylcarbamoyltransferase complex dimerization subunit type 1 TsaB [Cyanobacteria bacterium P01_A01_bin.105]